MRVTSNLSHVRKTRLGLSCLLLLQLLILPASADTFGSGGNAFVIDFAEIGDPGNTADDTGYGAVGHVYRIGRYEVSRSMIEAYNSAPDGGPDILMEFSDFDRPTQPATSVSWNEAARFVNWLNTSQGHEPAYKFTSGGANDDIVLWAPLDGSAYDPANRFRNPNAFYYLPSEDEWYKAAYHDPSANSGNGGYWDYATGSDTEPTPTAGGTDPGTAVYGLSFSVGAADVTNAGGLSPNGTMGQAGNVIEWMESDEDSPNNQASDPRSIRDGYWFWTSDRLQSSQRGGNSPDVRTGIQGFRVASRIQTPEIVLRISDLHHNATTVTADIHSTHGEVDVYRSLNLPAFGATPIQANLTPGSNVVIDSAPLPDRAFYTLVPAGASPP